MKKVCFVPCCNNTSTSAPIKTFIFVPRKEEVRKSWLRAVGIETLHFRPFSHKYCCEDHFDLKLDSIHFEFYKRTGKTPRIKKNIVPHLFIKTVNTNVFYSQLKDDNVESKETSSDTGSEGERPLGEGAQSMPTEETEQGQSLHIASPSKSTTTDTTQSISEVSLVQQDEDYMMGTSSSAASLGSFEASQRKTELQALNRKRETMAISMHPRFYLGLPAEEYGLVKIITSQKHITERDIFIVLKKIRLNDAFFRLGLDFGLSTSYVSKIFNKTIPKMEDIMRHFIFWPPNSITFKYLPIPFRYSYSKVTSIIDGFEISIEKPSNSIHQALTWSQYKTANTIKYLISSTPNGFINFVSEGYSGRVTDVALLEDCGYLNYVTPNSAILADRGFKHLESVLALKNIDLIRPSSVSADVPLSREQVEETRNIASLRVHIERVISRIREFHILGPHAQLDVHSMGRLNSAVVIACGIINLQPQLIKITY